MPEIDLSILWSASIFVHLALLFYVLGFLARDELWLRGLLLVGTFFYIIYYYYISDSPLWDAIVASSILGAANLYVIAVICLERSTVFMKPDALSLYRSFPTLSPGQFRQILAKARRVSLIDRATLAKNGETSNALIFLISGHAVIERSGTRATAEVPGFIGEIGFLLRRPATATVMAEPGAEYLEWDSEEIRALLDRKPELSNAMVALFNLDLAAKVARSMPQAAE